MSVGLGRGLLAILSGVQEGAKEIDAELAARIQAIKDSNSDENLKTKHSEEIKKYEADRTLIESINALGTDSFSGISTEQGQFLAGGYDSIEDYREAKRRADDAGKELYHNLPKIGDAPIYTPTTFGLELASIKKDGTKRNALQRNFNKLFRPEVYAENQAYAESQVGTEGSSTTYSRGESVETSKADRKILTDISKKSMEEKIETPAELLVNKVIGGVMMSHKLMKTNDTESAQALEAEALLGIKGYIQVGDAFETNTKSDWAVKMENHEAVKPQSNNYNDVDDYTNELKEWTYKYNKLMFGETFKEGLSKGDVISGVYDENNLKVNVQYMGDEKDGEGNAYSWNGMEGYRLFGYSSAPDTIAIGTQREYYDKETNTMQTLQFTGEDIHTHGEGDDKLVGWKPFGHARVIKEDSPSLSKTYNSKGQEVMITFDGNMEKTWDGTESGKGWVQVGDAKAVVDNWSTMDAMQRIDEAILSGTTLSEREYESGRVSFMRTKGAMEATLTDALSTYEDLTIMVRDFKHIKVSEWKRSEGLDTDTYMKKVIVVGEDGKEKEVEQEVKVPAGKVYKVGQNRVPATSRAIELAAEGGEVTVRGLRQRLLGL